MRIIYKYNIDKYERNEIMIPKDSVILDIQMQLGRIALWALVNPDNENETRIFYVVLTGNKLSDEAFDKNKIKYLKTFQAGNMVFHIFERINKEQ